MGSQRVRRSFSPLFHFSLYLFIISFLSLSPVVGPHPTALQYWLERERRERRWGKEEEGEKKQGREREGEEEEDQSAVGTRTQLPSCSSVGSSLLSNNKSASQIMVGAQPMGELAQSASEI